MLGVSRKAVQRPGSCDHWPCRASAVGPIDMSLESFGKVALRRFNPTIRKHAIDQRQHATVRTDRECRRGRICARDRAWRISAETFGVWWPVTPGNAPQTLARSWRTPGSRAWSWRTTARTRPGVSAAPTINVTGKPLRTQPQSSRRPACGCRLDCPCSLRFLHHAPNHDSGDLAARNRSAQIEIQCSV